ncbi:calcium-binding protein [Nitrosopumilus cobalaminigenes]|uniref:Calcium-binding protein n=1 Tax=Nitrosopumilus cobalaminigenes TaxID=1470066 RepID=A0A7D5M1I6_9ARCH|nr:calcium-binding protein [Nitrosopumilus cobalaminigenes]
MNVKPISIAALVVVPFVLFIAAGLVYQSQTGTDIVTGEKTGLAANEVGEKEFESILKNEIVVSKQDFDSHKCSGEAKCISQLITKIVDGDTIHTSNYKIRLSLVDTPEKDEPGFEKATEFTAQMCPVGSHITIDQDDLQPYDQYDRLIAHVFCEGKSLNSALLYNGLAEISTEFCITSEFADKSWAQRYGCEIESEPVSEISDCDSSYPDFCIPVIPPDLDCGDISQKRFTVLQPDPHRFDGDKDGIGCE